MRYLILMFGLCAAAVEAAPAADVLAAPAVQGEADLTRSQVRHAAPADAVQKATPSRSVEMTEAELLAQPELLRTVLDTAVEAQNIEHIGFLLGLYRKLPEAQQDKVLAEYAESFLLRDAGKHTEAEKRLRTILAEHPDFAPIRLQLAHTLAQNGQQREAAAEIAALRQTPELPAHVGAYLNQFDEYLAKERGWQFDAGASYLQESNVGRAPKQRTYGNFTFEAPRAAHGVAYDASARKTVPLKGHWALRVQVSGAGKFYWDAHDYDDLNLRAEAGGVWRDAKQEHAVLPFFEKRWYGTQPYSQQGGVSLRHMRVLSPEWQLHGAWQSGYKTHRERKHLDGASHGVSATLVKGVKQQWFSYGLDGGVENARDLSDAYRRYGVRAGWGKSWGKQGQVQTALHASVQRRHYRAPDFLNIQRRDTDLSLRASVSHQKIAWKGFAPRLNWQWTNTRSNHFYYRQNEQRVFVDITKRF